jgi:TorA maturation chaperone TorD
VSRADRPRSPTGAADAAARAYGLLALAFEEPSRGLADEVAAPDAPLSLPAVDAAALSHEYHRLFVGPDRLAAPPYESVYLDGGVVMGESTSMVARRYREAGYALDPSVRGPPDHVETELAFMALLAEEEAAAWEQGDPNRAGRWQARQREFLAEHLACWAPELSSRILGATEAPFYRGLAVALRELVAVEQERLAEADEGQARA